MMDAVVESFNLSLIDTAEFDQLDLSAELATRTSTASTIITRTQNNSNDNRQSYQQQQQHIDNNHAIQQHPIINYPVTSAVRQQQPSPPAYNPYSNTIGPNDHGQYNPMSSHQQHTNNHYGYSVNNNNSNKNNRQSLFTDSAGYPMQQAQIIPSPPQSTPGSTTSSSSSSQNSNNYKSPSMALYHQVENHPNMMMNDFNTPDMPNVIDSPLQQQQRTNSHSASSQGSRNNTQRSVKFSGNLYDPMDNPTSQTSPNTARIIDDFDGLMGQTNLDDNAAAAAVIAKLKARIQQQDIQIVQLSSRAADLEHSLRRLQSDYSAYCKQSVVDAEARITALQRSHETAVRNILSRNTRERNDEVQELRSRYRADLLKMSNRFKEQYAQLQHTLRQQFAAKERCLLDANAREMEALRTEIREKESIFLRGAISGQPMTLQPSSHTSSSSSSNGSSTNSSRSMSGRTANGTSVAEVAAAMDSYKKELSSRYRQQYRRYAESMYSKYKQALSNQQQQHDQKIALLYAKCRSKIAELKRTYQQQLQQQQNSLSGQARNSERFR